MKKIVKFALNPEKRKMEIRKQMLTRYITPLREGGSLPALAEADDGFKYAVKLKGAGHGTKSLISELIGGLVAKAFKFNVECVQTDNGQEFTKRLGNSTKPAPTLFEASLKQRGITHKLIKPYTPRHNGKVERSHRKDNEYFYATHTFYSFEDFKKQLAVHNRNYNNFPMRPLNWNSPADYVNAFLTTGEVF